MRLTLEHGYFIRLSRSFRFQRLSNIVGLKYLNSYYKNILVYYIHYTE